MSSFLTNEDYLIISRFLSFFSSSYGGQNTRLKLIQTLDHSMSICTSLSSRIQYQLKCQYMISRILSNGIQKQISIYHDGGLYFSIIFCSFLIQIRDISIDRQKKISLLKSCLNLIEQMNISKEIINWNSIHPLMAIVRGIICKPLAYNNSDLLREQICLLTVKSFLENITMINYSQQQLILTIQGLNIEESTLFNGLLYQIYTLNSSSSLCSNRIRTCLYFTISLAGDFTIEDVNHIEIDKQMFEWIENIANQIVKQILEYTQLHQNGLILCQKVIHPSIKTKLKQYGIDTIDRLGRQYTPYFCYLTNCQPIETLTFNTLDERYFGTITEIKRIEIGSKKFLQFSNQTRPFHTLLLCSNTEQSLLELKECVNTSHHILTNILLTKQVLYGGGCTESMQIFFLKTQQKNLAVQYLINTIRNIIHAQDNRSFVIDCIHGHLWFMSDTNEINDKCACELYSITDRFKIEWNRLTFNLDNEINFQNIKIDDEKKFFIKQIYPKYFDHFHMRTNAFRTAIETAINLHLTNFSISYRLVIVYATGRNRFSSRKSNYLVPLLNKGVFEQLVNQHGDVPSARSSHSLTAIDNYLYLFGGEHDPRIPIDNDVWQFSTADNQWKRLGVNQGEPPTSRLGHAAAAVEHKLFIFGGRRSVDMKDDTLEDLYSFDTDLQEWTQYKKLSDNDAWPEKRSYHSMVSSGDQLYLFGGCGEVGRLNNLWQYNTTDKLWTQLPTPDSEKLVARGGCGFVYLNNALWVFGGFCGHELSDIASFDLVTQTWTYLTDAKISPRSVFASGSVNGVLIGHGGEQNPSELGHAGAGEFADDVIIIQPIKENGDQVETKRVEFTKPVGGKRGWHAGATIKNTFYVFGGNTSENERDNSLLAIEFQ